MAAAAPKICLELCNVRVSFNQRPVLRDVNLVVREREVVSIIGPNGAGKTTLFNVISGLARPEAGAVFFHGREVTHWSPHRICHAGIARTFQVARPFPEMTALENVQVALCFGRKAGAVFRQTRSEALELLELVGLLSKVDEPAKELTLSEQRRLELARALGTKPHLLLLDEVAAGLSPQAIKQAVELVKTLQSQGLTLLIIDHFLALTAKVSDRMAALDQGEKIMEGSPAEVMRHPEVVSAYLGERLKGPEE
jgi:branched-chain amino acid transport system ATP-binding protein